MAISQVVGDETGNQQGGRQKGRHQQCRPREKRRDHAPDEGRRALAIVEAAQAHGKAPVQRTDEAENDGAVGVQGVAPQGGVVSIEEAGESQEDKRQKAAVA